MPRFWQWALWNWRPIHTFHFHEFATTYVLDLKSVKVMDVCMQAKAAQSVQHRLSTVPVHKLHMYQKSKLAASFMHQKYIMFISLGYKFLTQFLWSGFLFSVLYCSVKQRSFSHCLTVQSSHCLGHLLHSLYSVWDIGAVTYQATMSCWWASVERVSAVCLTSLALDTCWGFSANGACWIGRGPH